jgi:hypothetical protein
MQSDLDFLYQRIGGQDRVSYISGHRLDKSARPALYDRPGCLEDRAIVNRLGHVIALGGWLQIKLQNQVYQKMLSLLLLFQLAAMMSKTI